MQLEIRHLWNKRLRLLHPIAEETIAAVCGRVDDYVWPLSRSRCIPMSTSEAQFSSPSLLQSATANRKSNMLKREHMNNPTTNYYTIYSSGSATRGARGPSPPPLMENPSNINSDACICLPQKIFLAVIHLSSPQLYSVADLLIFLSVNILNSALLITPEEETLQIPSC